MTAMSLTLSILPSQQIGTTTVDQVTDTMEGSLIFLSLRSIGQSTLCTYLFTIQCTCLSIATVRVLKATPHPPLRVIPRAIQAARAKRKRGARGERKAARAAASVEEAAEARQDANASVAAKARVAAVVEGAAEALQEANASGVGVVHHLRTVATGTVM